MTEFEAHSDIDDELLSAYLDDELSPEERARVVARLASDPAAKTLLDELRAASSTVQGLPHETVGHDLSESVLRRAEEAMLTSTAARAAAASDRARPRDSAGRSDSLPRLTIGRTRRGWAWAALATAAGLMIMFWYPDERRPNNGLPALARKSGDVVDEMATPARPREPAELRQWHAPATPPSDSVSGDRDSLVRAESAAESGVAAPAPSSVALDSAAPAASEPQGQAVVEQPRSGGERGELAGMPVGKYGQPGDEVEKMYDRLGGTELDASDGSASAAANASGRRLAEAAPGSVAGRDLQLGTTVTGQAAGGALAKAPAPAVAADFLVVHVVVKRDTLDSKAFDRLLTKHGIVLEESPVAEPASAFGGAMLAEEKENVDRKLGRSAAQQPQDEEAVLVAAPRTTVEACLAELTQDQANYAGISVEDSAAMSETLEDKSMVEAGLTAKKLTDDLRSRFNRGTVPPVKAEHDRRFYFNDFFFAGREPADAGDRGLRGGAAGTPAQQPAAVRFGTSDLQSAHPMAQGRARRVPARGLEERSKTVEQNFGGVAGGERSTADPTQPPQLEQLQQNLRWAKDSAGQQLHVLFVLSPEIEAPAARPSPADENRAE